MSKPKHAVLIVTAPADWRPTRVHSIPPEVTAAEFLIRGVSLNVAINTAKAFNAAHLSPEKFTGQWALCIRAVKSRQYGANAAKGGAS
jgi:hypothetical protein